MSPAKRSARTFLRTRFRRDTRSAVLAAYREIRKVVRPLKDDRQMAPDMAAIERLVRDGSFARVAARFGGDLALH